MPLPIEQLIEETDQTLLLIVENRIYPHINAGEGIAVLALNDPSFVAVGLAWSAVIMPSGGRTR